MKKAISRRNLLRATAGATALMPFIHLARARAEGTAKKNVIIMTTPHGGNPGQYVSGTGRNYVLQEQWQALHAIRNDCTLIEGLNIEHAEQGLLHYSSILLLSAEPPVVPGGDPKFNSPGGASIDYYIAKTLRNEELLYCGIRPGKENTSGSRVSSSGRNGSLTPTENPTALVSGPSNVFAGTTPSDNSSTPPPVPPITDRLWKRDRAGVSFAKSQAEIARAKESGEVRERMDIMFDHLADMYRKYQGAPEKPEPPPGAVCAIPGVSLEDLRDDVNLTPYGTAFNEVIANALSCGARSVATLQWNHEADRTIFDWVKYNDQGTERNITATFHDGITHNLLESERARAQLRAIVNWYAGQFVDLVEKVRSRGILDSTILLWMTTGEHADQHWCKDNPVVIAGGGNAFPSHGSHLRLPASNISFLRTIAKKAGVDAAGWSPGRSPNLLNEI